MHVSKLYILCQQQKNYIPHNWKSTILYCAGFFIRESAAIRNEPDKWSHSCEIIRKPRKICKHHTRPTMFNELYQKNVDKEFKLRSYHFYSTNVSVEFLCWATMSIFLLHICTWNTWQILLINMLIFLFIFLLVKSRSDPYTLIWNFNGNIIINFPTIFYVIPFWAKSRPINIIIGDKDGPTKIRGGRGFYRSALGFCWMMFGLPKTRPVVVVCPF